MINEHTLPQYIDMMTDIAFVYPTYKAIKFHQEKANTFYIR